MEAITILLELLFVTIFAAVLQRNYKIPTPITLLTSVAAVCTFDFISFSITGQMFDTLVLLTLPLLIMADALKIDASDLKKNWFSLFWVAVVSVVLSVGIGVWIGQTIFAEYQIPVAGMVMLFCMVSATDPITLSAIFSNFKVPHQLKFLAEGESLLNDATALIIFSIAGMFLASTGTVSFGAIATKSVMVIIGAITIGFIGGVLTYFTLKTTDNPLVEASILLLGAYSSYLAAEHFHYSGILAVIVAMVIANMWIKSLIQEDDSILQNQMFRKGMGLRFVDTELLKYAATNKENHRSILSNIEFLSMFASTALFASMASLVNVDILFASWKEILIIFGLSTAIRAVMMLKFAVVHNNFTGSSMIRGRWWSVLTFAGSKGALSILMVHMIPDSFVHKTLFEQIIIGNILLSTIVYGIILGIIIVMFKEKFEKECENEH